MKILFILKKIIKKILPSFLIDWYHFILVFFSALFYSFPSYSKKIKVIGVTGTNGKSTVIKMISKILEAAGYKVAFSSSIKFKIGKREEENTLRMTMPGRFRLQKFLRQALDDNCQYALLEVTSEGIKQHRHRFIDFDIAVFTNLSPEHIEAHGSFEKYREAKAKLFKTTRSIHVLNLDDENMGYFSKFPAQKKYGYGLNLNSAKYGQIENLKYKVLATNCESNEIGANFDVDNVKFNFNLLGMFNVSNSLAAICVALSQNIDLEICKRALGKIEGIAGRMEAVVSGPFKVLVDYAFTPNALEKVYQTVKNSFNPKKIICVLGACGGGRDKWKRPILGKIAKQNCDSVIITNEDPYDEDPMEIINQIAEGAGYEAKKILDRREAIKEAIKEAQEGDVVIITGKGCESSICEANGKRIPWDDRSVVKEELDKK